MEPREMTGEPRNDRGRENEPARPEGMETLRGAPMGNPEPMDSAPAVAERRPEAADRSPGGRTSFSEAGTAARQAAASAAEAVRQPLSEAGERASDLAQGAAERARSTVGNARNKLHDAGQAVAARTGSFRDGAAEVLDDIGRPAPVLGSVLGALAGAVGGWWLGRSEPDADSGYTEEDARHYEEHFESQATHPTGMSYSRAQTGYLLGHVAARNPEYHGRDFEEIEPDLRLGFPGEPDSSYTAIREYAKYAFERREGALLSAILGGLAGALGGWWAGGRLDRTSGIPDEEETACRAHFVSIGPRHAMLSYGRARPGYLLGYYAARNPSYRGRPFEDIESELRRGFTGRHAHRYDTLREFTRFGYERGTGGAAATPQ